MMTPYENAFGNPLNVRGGDGSAYDLLGANPMQTTGFQQGAQQQSNIPSQGSQQGNIPYQQGSQQGNIPFQGGNVPYQQQNTPFAQNVPFQQGFGAQQPIGFNPLGQSNLQQFGPSPLHQQQQYNPWAQQQPTGQQPWQSQQAGQFGAGSPLMSGFSGGLGQSAGMPGLGGAMGQQTAMQGSTGVQTNRAVDVNLTIQANRVVGRHPQEVYQYLQNMIVPVLLDGLLKRAMASDIGQSISSDMRGECVVRISI